MKLSKKEKIALLNKKSKPVDSDAKWMKIAKWNNDHKDALEDFMVIALSISAALKEKKMTQKELAQLLNVKPQALTRIMKGRQNLTISTIRKIERVLNISIMNIKKIGESKASLKTRLINFEPSFKYSLSQSAFQGNICKLKPSNRREHKESLNTLSNAS